MNENDLAKSRKNEIRVPGKVLAVKSEPVTHPMHERPHKHLGLRVTALDP
jgi:hypothetical protein